VWLSLATFESNDAKSFVDAASTSGSSSSVSPEEEAKITDTVAIARAVYDKAYTNLKQQGLKEERVVLLEAWREVNICICIYVYIYIYIYIYIHICICVCINAFVVIYISIYIYIYIFTYIFICMFILIYM
jgi:hypothetical protein